MVLALTMLEHELRILTNVHVTAVKINGALYYASHGDRNGRTYVSNADSGHKIDVAFRLHLMELR